MKDPINIEELFKEKLQHLEASPKANAWSSIQSGLNAPAAATTAAASGTSWVGTAIVASALTVATVGGFFYFNAQGEKIKQKSNAVEQIDVKNTELQKITTIEQVVDLPKESAVESATIENNNPISEVKEIITTAKASKKTAKQINSAETIAVETKTAKVEVSNKTIDEIIAENQVNNQSNTNQNGENSKNVTENNHTTNSTSVDIIDAADSNEDENSNATNTEVNEADNKAKVILADKALFPNVFTPGVDGNNDEFKLNPEKLNLIDNVEVKIFSISGKMVGQWVGKYESWNGYLPNGTIAPKGQYSFMATIYIDGKPHAKKGGFTIF